MRALLQRDGKREGDIFKVCKVNRKEKTKEKQRWVMESNLSVTTGQEKTLPWA